MSAVYYGLGVISGFWLLILAADGTIDRCWERFKEEMLP